jgi:hypothetical protein
MDRQQSEPGTAKLSPPAPQSRELVVTAPQPVLPPAAAEPPSLAGRWLGSSNCPLASAEWEIRLAPVAREQYSITEVKEPSLTGWVSGKLVHMKWVGRLGETITADGTITSQTAMGGKRYLLLGITCDWWAKKS